ncbi:hypothetical protein BC827DRAFT_818228 [Russula dissimulans]|nr:hypothetical protein BC827DRAFT_818228 [Russula dissimulans]
MIRSELGGHWRRLSTLSRSCSNYRCRSPETLSGALDFLVTTGPTNIKWHETPRRRCIGPSISPFLRTGSDCYNIETSATTRPLEQCSRSLVLTCLSTSWSRRIRSLSNTFSSLLPYLLPVATCSCPISECATSCIMHHGLSSMPVCVPE